MIKKFFSLSIVVVCYILFVNQILTIYSAEIYLKKSEKSIKSRKTSQALKYINKSVENNPNEPKYFRQRAKILLLLSANNNDLDYKKLSFEDIKKSEDLNPHNLATLRNNIPIYYFLSINNLTQQTGQENQDTKYLKVATNYYSDIANKYITDAGTLIDIAKYQKQLGLKNEFEKTKNIIANLRPDLLEWNEVLK